MAASPWGQIDHVSRLFRGASIVSTPGHGGLRLGRAFAEKELPSIALKYAIRQGEYYFFEEDCAWSVAVYYSVKLMEIYREHYNGQCDIVDVVNKTIASWYPELLA